MSNGAGNIFRYMLLYSRTYKYDSEVSEMIAWANAMSTSCVIHQVAAMVWPSVTLIPLTVAPENTQAPPFAIHLNTII